MTETEKDSNKQFLETSKLEVLTEKFLKAPSCLQKFYGQIFPIQISNLETQISGQFCTLQVHGLQKKIETQSTFYS